MLAADTSDFERNPTAELPAIMSAKSPSGYAEISTTRELAGVPGSASSSATSNPLDVDQRNVRAELAGELNGLRTGGRDAHHRDPLALEQPARGGEEVRVVVDYQRP